MQKVRNWYRRKRLGKALKHQYQCHPDFNLVRTTGSVDIYWQKRLVKSLPLLSSLAQQYTGDVFTIATGPSLNEIPFDKLQSHTTLSLNCAIEKFATHGFSPDFCLIVDHRIFEKHWESIQKSVYSGAKCFFSAVGLSRICEYDPDLLDQGEIYLVEAFDRHFGVPRMNAADFSRAIRSPQVFADPALTARYKSIGFSRDAEIGFFSGKTVATWSVQLLNYLGFSRQFIAGMDLGGTGQTHFYGISANKKPDFLADYEPHIRVCFELAAQAAAQDGFEIYNLSKQSTLPESIIPKISPAQALELTERKPA